MKDKICSTEAVKKNSLLKNNVNLNILLKLYLDKI